jgi:hypothetical protein
MWRKHLSTVNRAIVVGLSGTVIVLSTTSSSGDVPHPKDRRSCAVSYEKAQELRQAGKLRRSKEALLACAKSTCGAFVQRECSKWLGQIDADMPTIVLMAKDEAGLPVVDVQVAMDGKEVAARLDGRAVPVDPGLHEFSFKTAGGAVVERRVAIAQGERNRLVSIELSPVAARAVAPPAPAKADNAKADNKETKPALSRAETAAAQPQVDLSKTDPEKPPAEAGKSTSGSPLPYIVGGVGVLGIGGYALLYGIAKSSNNSLIQECWPTCSESRLNRVRNTYLAADISLGVGVAAIGTATYLLLQSGSGKEQSSGQSTSYVVDVVPSRAGAFASVSGIF